MAANLIKVDTSTLPADGGSSWSKVYEGPQYKIRNIIWEGNTVYPDVVLTNRLEFGKGDVYDYQKFQMNLRGNEKQFDVSA